MRMFFLLISLLLGSGSCFADSGPEREVLREMNLARSNPGMYAEFVREHRKLFRGDYFMEGNVRIATSEGVAAVDEAIGFLRKQKPVPPLVSSKGLAEAAEELVREQGRSGGVGHNGRTSGSMVDRIERHGDWQGSIGENISYGFDDARQVVIQLIVDDGVRGRGHRKNIFNPNFKRAGVACGPHAAYGHMCAIDYAGGFSR